MVDFEQDDVGWKFLQLRIKTLQICVKFNDKGYGIVQNVSATKHKNSGKMCEVSSKLTRKVIDRTMCKICLKLTMKTHK